MLRKSTYLFLFFMLTSTISVNWAWYQYVTLPLYLGCVIVYVLLVYAFGRGDRHRIPRYRFSPIDLIPACMLLAWVYGVLLGFIGGNDPVAIARNFAGMVFYASYYSLCIAGLSKRDLVNISIIATWVNVATAVYFFGIVVHDHGEVIGVRTYYSAGLTTLCIYIAIAVSKWLSRLSHTAQYQLHRLRTVNVAGFLIVTLVLLAICLSKGFILAFLLLMAAIPALLAWRSALHGRVNAHVLVYSIVVLSLSIWFLSSDIGKFVTQLYDSGREGNQIRIEQARYLTADFSLLGKGLGAGLASGYSRDASGYGFELSYLNVIHKFGIVSVVIFGAYLATLYLAASGIVKNRDPLPSVAALGAMMFLLPAAGNPMLFAPVCSVLHCMALYWLRRHSPRLIVQARGRAASMRVERSCKPEYDRRDRPRYVGRDVLARRSPS